MQLGSLPPPGASYDHLSTKLPKNSSRCPESLTTFLLFVY